MDAYVSWRAALHRIDESGIAEDRNILTAAGENKSWVVTGELEICPPETLRGEGSMVWLRWGY